MKIADGKEQEYNDWYDKNRDGGYSEVVFKFAEEWAGLMEVEIDNGKKLSDVAKETAHKVASTHGITGFQYSCAVSILAHAWAHGEELRIWHNLDTQINDEGERANASGGVLNTAMLNIG
jgi:hypothetical protein